jgi:hypothetical protein
VCVVTGTFKDDHGQERPRFTKIGAWFETDKGLAAKLDVLPMPDKNGECWLKLFEAREQQPAQQQPPARQQPPAQQGGYRGRY